jgi:chromate transporter
VGAILYGSGYVLFAFLEAELVANDLLTRQELMDAIAIGQFTPGPVLSTATFIGYQLNGLSGAIMATVGIFLPSFLFVAFLNPLIPRMQKSKPLRSFLDAVNIGAVAVIIVVCIEMAKETTSDWRMMLIAAITLVIVFVFKKLNSAYIVLFGAVFGYALSLIA